MGNKLIDEIGHRYGKLVIIARATKRANTQSTSAAWICKCDCGKISIAEGSALRDGHRASCGCYHAHHYKDITGKRYGRLTAIKRIESKSKTACWECLCDCGKITNVDGAHLRNGSIKSCGCLVVDWNSLTTRLPGGVAAHNKLYNQYKQNAKRRNLVFALSIDDFRQLTSSNCHYCGVSPEQIGYANNTKSSSVYIHNGVDRKNNNEGYTTDNSVPCCWICNNAKRNLSYEKFIQWLDRITEKRNSKDNKEEIV